MIHTSRIQPVRLIDVAEAAGVSRATASKVLLGTGGPNTRVGEKTAARVREVADAMQFRPNRAAQQLKGARTHMIGLITGSGSSPILFDRLMRFETETWRKGYRLLPGHAHGDAERGLTYLDDLLARGAEGVIVVHANDELAEAIGDRMASYPHIPVVYQCQQQVPGQHFVLLDRAEGVRQAVHHLAKLGRRRIALAGVRGNSSVVAERRKGYRKGLKDCSLAAIKSLEWNHVAEDWHLTDFRGAVDALVVSQKADAIIASNDFVGVNLCKELRSRGIDVPSDVAVVGFDNLDIAAAADPELTSIDQCNSDVAQKTVALLTKLIESPESGQQPPQQIIVNPKLVIRTSSTPTHH